MEFYLVLVMSSDRGVMDVLIVLCVLLVTGFGRALQIVKYVHCFQNMVGS